MQSGSISIINLPGTGSLLSRTWLIYQRLSKSLVSLSIGLGLTFLVYLGVTSLLNFLVKDSSHSAQALIEIINTLVQLASCFAYAYFFTAMLFVIKHRDEAVLTMKEALLKAKSTYRSLLWIGVVSGLAIYGGAITMILPLLMSVWFYFAVYVLVTEGLRGTDALNKSRYLSRGNWFAIFGRYLSLAAIMGVIALVIYMLSAIPAAGAVVFIVMFVVFLLAALPFFAIYDFLRYEDLVELPRTQGYQSFRGEKHSVTFFAIIGLIITVVMWIGSLLTCVQRTSIANNAKGAAAVIVLSIAQNASVNLEGLSSTLDKMIYVYHPDVCPLPPRPAYDLKNTYPPTSSSGTNNLNGVPVPSATIPTTPSSYDDYLKTLPSSAITPTNP